MEQDRAARIGIGADEAIELVLGADVDAAGRIEQQQDSALGEQPLGDRDLLLVAARERADPRPQCAAIHVDPLENRLDRRRLADAVDERPAGKSIDDRQGGVVLAAERQRQRLGLAVLRDEADADIGAHRVRRRGDDDRLAVDAQASRRQVGHAETGEKQIELAHALQAGDAEDFAGAQAERGVAELAGGRNALGREHLGSKPALVFTRREGVRERAAGDHADDFVVGIGGDGPGRDMPAVAQDRHRVAEGPHLPQAMGNEHRRHALGP